MRQPANRSRSAAGRPQPATQASELPGMVLNSRLSVLFACALLTSVLVTAYARDMVADLLLGLLTDGIMVAGWLLAAGLLGLVILRPYAADGPRSLRLLTAIALGLGCFSIAALLLGLAGWLNRATALAMPLLGAGSWVAMQARRGRLWQRADSAWTQAQQWLKEPAGWSWLLLLVVPFLAILIVGASIIPGFLWRPFDPHPYDVMEYHLQTAREWFEAGRIHPLYHNVYNFFPGNKEMHSLLMMHLRGDPWKAMYMAQYFSAACMMMAMAAIFATVRSIGANERERGRGAVLAVCAASAVPWVAMLGSVAYVESMLMLCSTLALAWTMRAMNTGETRWRIMLLAGILAGFACGVKYTAVPVVLALLPAVFVAVVGWRDPKMAGQAIANGAAFVLVGLVVFSPWLIRNAAWTGNPIFPLEMKLLGQGHFDDAQVKRFDIAHKVRAEDSSLPVRLNLARRGLIDWQYAYLFMPIAFGAIALLIRRPDGQFILLVFVLQLIFWVFFTHLMPRFAVLLIPLGAIAIGLCAAGRLFPTGVTAVAIIAAVGLLNLHTAFAPRVSGPSNILIRWNDMDALAPDLKALHQPDSKLALIGDAQPFFHRFPPGHIEYRTVFDIRFPPGKRSMDAWLGRHVKELQKDYILYVHPAELRRLSHTYHGVPPLEKDWLAYLREQYAPVRPVLIAGEGSQTDPDNAPVLFPRKP